jgi:hypothetical protein
MACAGFTPLNLLCGRATGVENCSYEQSSAYKVSVFNVRLIKLLKLSSFDGYFGLNSISSRDAACFSNSPRLRK